MNLFWLAIFQLFVFRINGFYLHRFSNQLSLASTANDNSNNNPYDQVPRSNIPSRYDACKVLITGMIGTEPKERYISNGHYVLSFSLAIVGHFKPIHDWEKFKHTETMWMNCEAWDELAKSNSIEIRKGKYIRGIGYLVFNKWIDKTSGEEKKMNKLRITKLLTKEEFDSIEMIMNDLDNTNNIKNTMDTGIDSGFSSEFPPLDNQVQQYNHYNKNDNNINNNISLDSMNNKPWKKNNFNNVPVNNIKSNMNNNENNYKSNNIKTTQNDILFTQSSNKNNIPESKIIPNKISSNKKTDRPADNNWISWGNEDEDTNMNVDSMPWWE